jgi:hypothetical protein
MNHQERQNAIGTLLREVILPRYKRPEHLDDETARRELGDMVADLNAEWPLMPAHRFGEVCDGMARAIRTTHTSRTWPTIAALVKALGVAIAPPVKSTEGDDAKVEAFLYGLVVEWWHKHHDAMPSVAKEHHTARMVREGIATAGALRRAGFPVPAHLRDETMGEPDPRQKEVLSDLATLGERIRANGGHRGDIRLRP